MTMVFSRVPRRVHLACWLFSLALMATAVPLSAQEEAQNEDEVLSEDEVLFFDAVEVTVVNVDVYVTDRQGRPVEGLEAADFELLADGKRVPISNFYSVVERQRLESADPPPAPEEEIREEEVGGPPKEPPSRRLADHVPPDQVLSLILYFDNLHLAPHSRTEVIRETRRFLHDHVAPGDQVMVVTFERSLHVRQPFTNDLSAIGDALFEIEKLTALGQQRATERRDVIRRVQRAQYPAEADAFVGAYADAAHHDVLITIDALKGMVDSLAGLPGRKALVYVSDGVPMSAAEDLYMMVDQQFNTGGFGNLEAARYRVRSQFRALTARANADRVTFYTIDARGLRAMSRGSAEERGSYTATLIDVETVKLSNHQETLELMADDTGGIAILSAGDLAAAMDRIATDFGHYYSLGYQPSNLGQGRYHDLDVRVKGRRGLKVRHRKGYRSKSAETLAQEGTLAALLFGVENNKLDVEVSFERPKTTEEGNFLVPVVVRIPLAAVTLVPQEELFRGRILVSMGVINEEGEVSSVSQQEVPITVPASDLEVARTKEFVYSVDLMMREGIHRVAVGVRDKISGESSFLKEPFRVGG